MTAPWTIDKVCALTRAPALLNALHACRPDHPLGRGVPRSELWLNVYGLAYGRYFEIPSDALAWIESNICNTGEVK